MTGFAPRTRGRISPHTAYQTSSHVGIAGFLVDDSSSKSAQPPNGPPRILIPGVPPRPQTVRRLVLQTAGREDSAARTPEIVRHPAPGPDRFFHPPMQIRRTRRRFPVSGSFWKSSEHGDSIPSRQIWRRLPGRRGRIPSNRPVDEEPHPLPGTPGLLSGLMRCALCGSGMTLNGGKYACSAARERETCKNNKIIAARTVEDRVLAGVRRHLLSPEAIASAVRIFHEEQSTRRLEATSPYRARTERDRPQAGAGPDDVHGRDDHYRRVEGPRGPVDVTQVRARG